MGSSLKEWTSWTGYSIDSTAAFYSGSNPDVFPVVARPSPAPSVSPPWRRSFTSCFGIIIVGVSGVRKIGPFLTLTQLPLLPLLLLLPFLKICDDSCVRKLASRSSLENNKFLLKWVKCHLVTFQLKTCFINLMWVVFISPSSYLQRSWLCGCFFNHRSMVWIPPSRKVSFDSFDLGDTKKNDTEAENGIWNTLIPMFCIPKSLYSKYDFFR